MVSSTFGASWEPHRTLPGYSPQYLCPPDRGTAGSIPGGYGEEMERGRKKDE